MINEIYIKVMIILVGYVFLLSTSGLLVKFILSRVKHEKGAKGSEIATQEQLDVGFIIGKCENILIVSFVLFDAYTALALIFAAKTIIRENEIKNNSLYFLAGTMVNVTYSIVVGIVLKGLIGVA
jgi:hypothetical protein